MPSGGSVVRGSVGSSGSDSPLEGDGLLASRAGGRGRHRGGAVPQQHKVGWMDLSWLMLTDVVGTSVLAFAGVAAALGWALSVSLIVLACPVAVYTAILMARSYRILQGAGLEVGAMGEAARHTLGGARGARLVYVAVYGFALLGNSSYLLVLGKALQGVFYDAELCLPSAVAYSCLALVPFITAVRRLRESVLLCFVNLFLILGVLAICVYQLAAVGRAETVRSYAVATDIGFDSVCGALTNIIYAYAGHWLYYELLHTMRRPEDFSKVFVLNAPLQVALYLVVACTGYYFQGEAARGYLLDNLPPGGLYRAASGLLFVHVLVVYLIKSVVLARFFHACVAPGRVDEPSLGAHAQYAGFALAQLGLGFVVANAIPFFDALLSLIGGLLSAPISYGFPVLFYLGAVARFGLPTPAPAAEQGGRAVGSNFVSLEDDEEGAEQVEEEAAPAAAAREFDAQTEAAARGPWLPWARLVGRRLAGAYAQCPRAEQAAFAGLLALVAAAMLVGTAGNVRTVAGHIDAFGLPFECHALDLASRR